MDSKTPNETIRRSICDICTPGPQCGVDLHIRDGRVVRLEGTAGYPVSDGQLCVRGAAGRQYLYRADRIRTPLKRTGPRGSGQFEPIGWDEALSLCAEELGRLRREDPDSVVWLTGYPKWYRPFLHRLAHSFGTRNYLTESSTCHQAEVMSYKALFGRLMNTSPARAGTIVCWGVNAAVSAWPLGRLLQRRREEGARFIVIDPRHTHAVTQLAELWLRPRAGTDGALAHAVAYCLLEEGLEDRAFIERYVHGLEKYRRMVQSFPPERAEEITGVPAGDIRRLAEALAADPTAVILPSNALTHRVNGFNTHRAILSLMVLLGRVDKEGGLLPVNESFCHADGGFVSREEEFIREVMPTNCKTPIGHKRFPLWADMVNEGQAMDLVRQVEEGTPYPLRSFACFGVNDRMFPESARFLAAMDKMKFTFAADLFMTDVCRHADIVLPVCTSYERGEVKCCGGHYINYTRPAIAPLYDSRPDTDILFELARRLELDDALLTGGYDACIQYIFEPAGITDWEAVRRSEMPVPVPNTVRRGPGDYLDHIPTPSGKIELYSEAAAAHPGLDPLPVYRPEEKDEDYPLTLIAGARLPHAIHSRVHEVPWLRAFRPEPTAEINPADAEALGIRDSEWMLLRSPVGEIRVRARLTEGTAPGEIQMLHGYREANVNALLAMDQLDKHTGFPAYKQMPCAAEPIPGQPDASPALLPAPVPNDGPVRLRQERCIACGACAVACQDAHNLTVPLRRCVTEEGRNGGGVFFRYRSESCRHCADAACLAVCPTGCITRDANSGLIIQNPAECIGCRACQKACPWDIPVFDDEGRMRKCDGCLDRKKAGLAPACVTACPMDALYMA